MQKYVVTWLFVVAEGYVDVYSENSYGVCVPLNSSANEVIFGMARASALQNSGDSGKDWPALLFLAA